jgi:hypothetical protein
MLALHRAAGTLGQSVQIQVRGNHDPIGPEEFNSALARTRAENVRATLVMLGVPAEFLSAVSEDLEKETCGAVKQEERTLCRSASLHVIGIP